MNLYKYINNLCVYVGKPTGFALYDTVREQFLRKPRRRGFLLLDAVLLGRGVYENDGIRRLTHTVSQVLG